METPCGFNPQLLELLATTLKGKPEIQRHGILLLDEMATRQGVQLDKKNFELQGAC